ncbi:toxin-antitoxin system YwqK family antitoxin [Nocardia rhizosphaerae]|uniref:Toxin-antitoxin system YwqK family antitoxin n=1 Tax=Nocardia rhizosphaerae TaxID=1691571 RepID=A0ABV8L1N5_9NOCA
MTEGPIVDVDDPEFELSSGDGPTRYRGVPYTGVAVETNPDGTVVGRWSFVDGYDDGPSQAWYADGSPASDGTMRRGLAVGEWREWRPDHTLASLEVYTRPGYLRLRKQWDADGVLVEHQLLACAPGDVFDLRPLGMFREMYDGTRDDLPSIHDARAGERPAGHARVLEYLRAAPTVFDVMSAVPDLFDPDRLIPGGASLHSDGVWIWRTDFIEYYAEQALTLPPEFLDYIRENSYRPARFDLADQNLHEAIARQR